MASSQRYRLRARTLAVISNLLILLIGSCTTKPVAPPPPILPVPNESQMEWHAMEMNAFIHFSINTFTDKEWGYGNESSALFDPTNLDADQWVSALKETGFKGVILTTKHHDGFCLWPSKLNSHNVEKSPYKNGKGDVVREVSDACKRQGLKFGIYVSPWDRNHASYGTPAYVDYYRNQLKELFTNYGPIFEMWFDGANGGDGYYGGANEKRSIDGSMYYDWPATLNMVRAMEPDVIFFSDAGPGVRWVGNEKGVAGETNWNTITPDTLYAGKAGIENLLNSGSEGGTHWIPAEVDVSIRPGWFYHQREDTLVKTPEKLFEIYLTSVGRGATLLLNVPPDRRGLLHENDIRALRAWRELIDKAFRTNLAANARAESATARGASERYSANMVTDENPDTYWATDDGVQNGSITIDLGEDRQIKYILIQEFIRLGQRVKEFDIEVWQNDGWRKVASGTTIGYKRILKIEPVEGRKVRINIRDARACPLISKIAVY